jgi:hypothetical protein
VDVEREKAKDEQIDAYRSALFTIANLEPSFKGVMRKYQMAIQTARIALGLEVK